MYIYQTGLIGEAVRAKIENTKSAVMSGTHSTESFTDILRSMMTDTSKVTKAVNLLNAAEGADKETLIPVITDLVDKYNSLMTGLTAQSTASGIMYTRLFKTAAQTASEPLAKAGITADDTGKLTFDPNKFEEQDISGFISTVSSAANAVSTYASSVTGSQNGTLLDFLSGDEDSDSSYVSTSNYYNSLINSLM